MKRFVAVLLVLLCSCCFFSAFATESFKSYGYTYTLNPEGGATITKGINGDFVVIPASLDGYPVTEIGYRAFRGCSNLTEITIPDSVTSIGDEAFWECCNLKGIRIPDSVTSIGNGAFRGCFNLKGIVLSEGLTSIGDEAFRGCSDLTSIRIPDSVTSIGSRAFSRCESLFMIDISAQNGAYAQIDCALVDKRTKMIHTFPESRKMLSYAIPEGIVSIGDEAFSGCKYLTYITVPDSVTSIGSGAFERCDSLVSINISAQNEAYSQIDGGALVDKRTKMIHTFLKGRNATSYAIPEGIVRIGDKAFYGCYDLMDITIPFSVTSIGDEAFYGCESLTDITTYCVTSIGDRAFYGCRSLMDIALSANVMSIGDEAFSGCESLTDIVIPQGMTSIGDRAFYYCRSLNSIVILDSETSIGDEAFWGCSESLTIKCTENSPAHAYAVEKNIFYLLIQVQ